ncbi:MAG TPA: FAD-binding oxidoreductase [Vicinamibacteria bacterium]|nr:FAD-binding oxidoreductase [Vicinamibacteria bacterium]
MTRETADIVILGAGVMGTSIAYHLAQRRAGRIVLIERDVVASGASGASSALVRMHYSFPPEVRLAVKSLEYFTHWTDWLGRPSSFRQTGFFRIVPESEEPLLRANVAMQRECGADTRIVRREEIQEIEPHWNVDDVGLAAYEPGSGYCAAATVASDFLERARELGVRYVHAQPVHEIQTRRGRVTEVVTKDGSFETRIVVVAAGVWSYELLRGVGVELPLETELHDVVILDRPPGIAPSHAAGADSILRIYFRSDGQRETLVGDFYGTRGGDPDEPLRTRGLEELAGKVELLSRRIPAMANAGIVRCVSGLHTMTPDTRGLMGPLAAVDGLYCCTGFSEMGFKIAPAVGLVMSEMILDGKSHTVDVRDFYPDRFVDEKPIRARYEYGDD